MSSVHAACPVTFLLRTSESVLFVDERNDGRETVIRCASSEGRLCGRSAISLQLHEGLLFQNSHQVIVAIIMVEDSLSFFGNHLEELKGDRAGQHSVRINGQWRICFVWTPNGPADVEIVDYH
jgi:plasmid maintenance system killer protein